MTSAFDCVDHVILTERLRTSFGLRDTALLWFQSFLENRMISVYHASSTRFVRLSSGVYLRAQSSDPCCFVGTFPMLPLWFIVTI